MAAAKTKKKTDAVRQAARLFTLRELAGKNTYLDVRGKAAKEIKDVIANRIQQNLSGKAKPPFKPLSPAYKKWKLKNYGRLPILVLTGRSKRTCKVMATKEGGRSEKSVLKIKVKAPSYFWYHHTGTRYLPKRDWLALQAKDKREIKKIIESSRRAAVSQAQRKASTRKRGGG